MKNVGAAAQTHIKYRQIDDVEKKVELLKT